MKKLMLFIIFLLVLTCGGCKKNNSIKVLVPNGAPLIAVSGIENDDIILESVSGPSLLTAAMTSKSHDIIVAPITNGVKLYNAKASNYQLHSIITFSNIYIVSTKTLDSINDLVGKKIIGYGLNTTPGLILEKALEKIDKEIEYVSSVSDAVGYLINQNDEFDYILTAEPTLSNLVYKKNLKLNVLDLSEVVKDEIPLIPQAGIFINPDSMYKKEINKYINQIKENINYLNINPLDHSKKIINTNQWLTDLGEEIIHKSIPTMNIDFKKAIEYKNQLSIFYDFLNNIDKDILSGDVDEKFYYQ